MMVPDGGRISRRAIGFSQSERTGDGAMSRVGEASHPPYESGQTVPARRIVMYCLVILSMTTAVIHFAVAGEHYQECWAFGVFMLLTAWLQLAWAAAAIIRPFRLLLHPTVISPCPARICRWLRERRWRALSRATSRRRNSSRKPPSTWWTPHGTGRANTRAWPLPRRQVTGQPPLLAGPSSTTSTRPSTRPP